MYKAIEQSWLNKIMINSIWTMLKFIRVTWEEWKKPSYSCEHIYVISRFQSCINKLKYILINVMQAPSWPNNIISSYNSNIKVHKAISVQFQSNLKRVGVRLMLRIIHHSSPFIDLACGFRWLQEPVFVAAKWQS